MSTRIGGHRPVSNSVPGNCPEKETNLPVPSVLVIDDEEDVRTLLCKALRKQGYEVGEASDGWEGIRTFRRRRDDLVIVDLFMPKKEGIETVMEIREIEPDVKVIVISGGGLTANLELLTLARSFGADRTFAKPFKLGELLGSVCSLIGPAS